MSQVYTTPELGQPWTLYGNISHAGNAQDNTPEDPFMWIDKRGNWHIINHAYDVKQVGMNFFIFFFFFSK